MSSNAIAKQFEEMYAIAFIIVSLEIEQNKKKTNFTHTYFFYARIVVGGGGAAVFRHWKNGLPAHRTRLLANKLYYVVDEEEANEKECEKLKRKKINSPESYRMVPVLTM